MGLGGDQRPHVKLSIHWSPVYICVLTLVDSGTKCSLIHGNSEFPRDSTVVGRYGVKIIRVKQAQTPLGIGCLPTKKYIVYKSPITYILGIDILQGLWL